MRQLVNDALTLVWLTHESPTLGSDTFDLVDLLDALMDDVRFEYSEHQWHVELPDSALLENSSQRALAQALENLLRNACHYSSSVCQTPTLYLSLRQQKDYYQLTLRDNGPGVEEAQLQHLFTPFTAPRMHVKRAPRAPGWGLPLHCVKSTLCVERSLRATTLRVDWNTLFPSQRTRRTRTRCNSCKNSSQRLSLKRE
ncbi:hypothetical protein HSBAA_50320 [Vreelandella sulfidaeris]|uniref:histidine kinase n=1 Tax=Vreelandella sulfidaeris TaxID=115553 RepID=A0A455UBX5_9GAMM|nr:hypothetical protein HSBAA_50320 [Halomonas sulfidaeris]